MSTTECEGKAARRYQKKTANQLAGAPLRSRGREGGVDSSFATIGGEPAFAESRAGAKRQREREGGEE